MLQVCNGVISIHACLYKKYTYVQKCIASTESSGIDIIVQILQAELTALDDHQDLALELKVCNKIH